MRSYQAELQTHCAPEVKFEIEKGKGFNISKNYLILKAVMLLEDIPNEFEKVKSF